MQESMTESKMMGMPTMGNPMMGMPSMGASGMNMSSNMGNMMIVPRCMMQMEKCDGGMKMMCTSTDQMTVGMMQNLSSMMSGGMTSMNMMMNVMMVMNCNMMGMCKYEMMTDGMMMTCTSGDDMACKMIQACCDCMMTMMASGCNCYLCMNNMPICCG